MSHLCQTIAFAFASCFVSFDDTSPRCRLVSAPYRSWPVCGCDIPQCEVALYGVTTIWRIPRNNWEGAVPYVSCSPFHRSRLCVTMVWDIGHAWRFRPWPKR